MYSLTLRVIFKKEFDITIGYGTYGGCFNSNNIPPGVSCFWKLLFHCTEYKNI